MMTSRNGRRLIPAATWILAVLAVAPTAAGAAAPSETTPAPGGRFSFVIVGDTRPHFASEDFTPFEKLIPRINARKPAFVINLGDLIFGYRFHRLVPQWDKYEAVIRNFTAPYYQIPGNHDAYSAAAREVYRRRFGRFYRSFDYGGWHFVLLDDGEGDRWGYLGPDEFAWLKSDLRDARGRPVFVFAHFPVWIAGRFSSESYDFWRTELQPLFKTAGVRAVFGGHFHTYGPTFEFDGIKYFITGGGGAELNPGYSRAGGEHHFLKVDVAGEAFDVRVVTESAELSDAEADLTGGLIFADKNLSWIGIAREAPGAVPALWRCSLTLNNPYEEPLSGRAIWAHEKSVIEIDPGKTEIRIPPKSSQTYSFEVRFLKADLPPAMMPRVNFDLSSGGRRHVFHREVQFLERLEVPFRSTPVNLDGRLDDWAAVPALPLKGGLRTEAEVRACHDGRTLYLLASVPDPLASSLTDGTVRPFRDTLQIGFSGRLTATEFSTDELKLGFACAGMRTQVVDRTPGQRSAAEAADRIAGVKAACRSAAGRMVFEIAVPERALRLFEGGKSRRPILNISYWEPESEEVSGEGLLPVHFVELVLGRGR